MLMNGVQRCARGNEGSSEMSHNMNDEATHNRADITGGLLVLLSLLATGAMRKP